MGENSGHLPKNGRNCQSRQCAQCRDRPYSHQCNQGDRTPPGLYFHKQFLGQISYKKYQENILKFSDREISVCNHFYQENKRVKKGLKAIENNDVDTLFECIDNSAKSNQNNLKNSQIGDIYIDSLQNIIDFSKNILHNEIAIKLTGGGFAGACIAFIKNNKLKILKKAIKNSNKNWEIIPLK